MIRKKIAVSLMLSLGLFLGGIVYAEHGQDGKMDHGMHMDKMAKELKLTEAQKEQVKNIMEEKKQKMEEHWKQVEEIKNSTQEKIKSLLTEEQKKTFESFHSKHHGKKEHKHMHGENCTMGCCNDKK